MGLNEADRLKAAGIEAKKASVTRLPLSQLQLVTTGATAHPRAGLAPDEGLVVWIMTRGMVGRDGRPWRFVVRETGVDEQTGVMGLEVGDGSRRTNAGLEAERRLRETAPRQAPLHFRRDDPTDLGKLFVDVELFNGSDAEFILARLAANSEPGKLADSTEVLAITVAQLVAVGCDDPTQIAQCMPRGVGKKEVQALARWELLTPEAKAFVVERDLPPGFLAAILDAPRAQQVDVAAKLHASGASTTNGAKRVLARDREERTGEPAVKARRWIPRKLVACAKAINVPTFVIEPGDDGVALTREELRKLLDDAEGRGFAKALNFAAGEKTGKLPSCVRVAIKAVNGQGAR